MAQSTHLEALLGPSLIAVSLTESIHFDIFMNTAAHLAYLNGALLFVAGLAIEETPEEINRYSRFSALAASWAQKSDP